MCIRDRDGVILMAFILGFPANEIVIPIAIMTYLATGSLIEMDNLMELKNLLVANGWTWITALCTMVFSDVYKRQVYLSPVYLDVRIPDHGLIFIDLGKMLGAYRNIHDSSPFLLMTPVYRRTRKKP